MSSTPRGTRFAPRLALHQLDAWGVPHGSRPSDTAALLVTGLAANAVTHDRAPDRNFELAVKLPGRALRIEVSGTWGERRPPGPGTPSPVLRPLAEKRPGYGAGGGARLPVGRARPRPVGETVVAEPDPTH